MNLLRIFAVSCAVVALPLVASAQVYNSPACQYPYGNTTYTCGPQTLLVYVQTPNAIGASYVPGSVAVSVSGNNPMPATFPGSVQGTPVTLGLGNYSVSLIGNTAGLVPTYSSGCSGTIYPTGQGPTCVITLANSGGYGAYPVTPYPYPYAVTALSCAPAYQTVNTGQAATFTALGGGTAVYNWSTPNRTFLGTGPVLSTSFPSAGVQTVVVQSAAQSATCTVNVLPAPVPASAATITAIIPALPNTGLPPSGAAAVALAIVLLGVAAIITYPYVRTLASSLLGR